MADELKRDFTVFNNNEAREVFDTFKDAENYIFFHKNPDKHCIHKDHWQIGEYVYEKEGIGNLVKMYEVED